jgi:hypothetical protein
MAQHTGAHVLSIKKLTWDHLSFKYSKNHDNHHAVLLGEACRSSWVQEEGMNIDKTVEFLLFMQSLHCSILIFKLQTIVQSKGKKKSKLFLLWFPGNESV